MIEMWKGILGYETRYQISNLGKVKSLPKTQPNNLTGGYSKTKERLMVGGSAKKYKGVLLNKECGGYKKFIKIHRLVAETFLENPDSKPFVNHRDGDTHNNRLDNLEWVTHQENMRHATACGLTAKGSEISNSKLTEEAVKMIKDMIKFDPKAFNDKWMGKCFKVNRSTISNIRRNLTWRHV